VEVLLLTTWRHNQTFHRRIPKPSTGAYPKPIEATPHAPPPRHSIHPKMLFDPILPSTPRSSEWCLFIGVSDQNLLHFPLHHAPPTSFSLIWYAKWYFWMSTNYEAPHCTTFSILQYVFLISRHHCSFYYHYMFRSLLDHLQVMFIYQNYKKNYTYNAFITYLWLSMWIS
jgi:hypothetical protein